MSRENEYKTVCDKCRMPTWYETEQQCHRSYARYKVCDLGHRHEDEPQVMEQCTGTLRVIDRSDLDARITPYYDARERVEIEYTDGSKVRCWIGRSTGWKPVYLEILKTNSHGGSAIPSSMIKSVRGLGKYR